MIADAPLVMDYYTVFCIQTMHEGLLWPNSCHSVLTGMYCSDLTYARPRPGSSSHASLSTSYQPGQPFSPCHSKRELLLWQEILKAEKPYGISAFRVVFNIVCLLSTRVS